MKKKRKCLNPRAHFFPSLAELQQWSLQWFGRASAGGWAPMVLTRRQINKYPTHHIPPSNFLRLTIAQISKVAGAGVIGECGMRGGYMQTTNIDESTHEQLYKLASISLCSNVTGQVSGGGGGGGGWVAIPQPPTCQTNFSEVGPDVISSCFWQVMCGLMVDPPVPGDPSYPLYSSEYNATFASLQRRAAMATKACTHTHARTR